MEDLVKIAPLILKGSLQSDVVQIITIEKVLEQLNKVNLKSFKMHNQITELIMQMVEDSLHEHRKSKIDKKVIVLEISKQYFNLTQTELDKLSSDIEYIFKNGLILVASKALSTKAYHKVSKLFGSKKISKVKSSHTSSKR